MSYSIVSGWYADATPRDYTVYGDDFVRSVACFDLWYRCITRFTDPSKILVVDSASPLRPQRPDDVRLEWLGLSRNYGHAAQNLSRLSGWSRALLCGLAYGYANGDDYTVLVEQGTLFRGERIIERQIEAHPAADVIAMNGIGTPQPLQTAILIFRTAAVPRFIDAYTRIPQSDGELSPEKKVVLAAAGLSLALSDLGCGRRRPIDWSAEHLVIRHAVSSEIESFVAQLDEMAERVAVDGLSVNQRIFTERAYASRSKSGPAGED